MSTAVNPTVPAPPRGPVRPYRGVVILALILGAAIAGAVIYWNRKDQLPAPAELGIRTARIERGWVERIIRLSGTTQAQNYYSLTAPEFRAGSGSVHTQPAATGDSSDSSPGRWKLVLQDVVPGGSRVTKGQVIAEFDRHSLLAHLDNYRQGISESDAALRTQAAEADAVRKAHDQTLQMDEEALERARLDMRKIPVLSVVDAERLRLNFDEAQARYEQVLYETPYLKKAQEAEIHNSELDLSEARLALKRAEGNAEKMIVRSPAGGLAVMETAWRGGTFGKIEKGDSLWPGETFLKVVDTSSMLVNATVNQVDIGRLQLGAKAKVSFDAYPDLSLNATVEAIGAAAGSQTGRRVRRVPVRLRIESKGTQPDPRLIPDLTVSVDVEAGPPVPSATVAPLGAIFDDHAGNFVVYVKNSTGWSARKVKVGARNNTMAAIISGVAPGDMVALDQPPSMGSE